MKHIKVGAAVLNQTPLDWRGNLQRIVSVINEAKQSGVALLCLPELCLTGYGCEDAFHSAHVLERCQEQLQTVCEASAGLVVSVGLPLFVRSSVYNTACLVVDGEPVGFSAKQFLANDGIHYEQRWFQPWRAGEVAHYRWGDQELPVGDLCYEIGGVKILFEICNDAWVASRPGGVYAAEGIDIILNPSASHFAFGKDEIRKRLVLEGSRAFGCGYLYANLLGNEAGRIVYDGGALIASRGEFVGRGSRFRFVDSELVTAVIPLELQRFERARLRGVAAAAQERTLNIVRRDFCWSEAVAKEEACSPDVWEVSAYKKEEEFARAVSLSLFDYLRKSHSHGFVLSLSGGADSTSVALLVRLMTDFVFADIGPEGVQAKFSHIPAVAACGSAQELMNCLLTCVYQSTRNNTETTRSAAQTVAQQLGANYCEVNIEDLVQQYVKLGEAALGIKLNWTEHDIALQNIQARVRAPGVWLIANVKNALLLATSNRSEAAVGYTTMDGDTAGSIAPIAGIDKAFLLRWLRWMETTGPAEVGAFPMLQCVTSQAPSAELRPTEAAQTDESDLMPYAILDAIERWAIRDKLPPKDIAARLLLAYPEAPKEDVMTWVQRFFTLWCRNQWKRERFAPSFHLDDENLDPKSWCRFPILSGGYKEELESLSCLTPHLRKGF